MAYTKKQFAAELILEMERGYNKNKIAEWADKIHYKHQYEIDDQLNEIIQNIASMSFGKEFEYSKDELIKLAVNLILEE